MRSLFRSAGTARADLNLVVMGDSIGAGFELAAGQDPASQAASKFATLGYTPVIHNVAVPSTKSSDGVAEYAGTVAPLYSASTKWNVLLVEYGTNDAFQVVAESTWRANQKSLVASGRATGFRVVVWCPGHDFNVSTPSNYETDIAANNAYWLTQIGTGADGVASWYQDAIFSTSASAGWFSVGDVHPSAAGASVIGRTYLVPAILKAIGAA